MNEIISGFTPQDPSHLLAIIPPVVLWWLTRSWAKERHIIRWHTASFAVSFWEEALFRGLLYGLILSLTASVALALIISSLLFGLFHVRNRWWADRPRVIVMCLYAGLLAGPLFALLRLWSGDIYLGILAHFLNNFISMRRARGIPTDEYLAKKHRNQNWFERRFTGD